jgi:hypothetical protein
MAMDLLVLVTSLPSTLIYPFILMYMCRGTAFRRTSSLYTGKSVLRCKSKVQIDDSSLTKFSQNTNYRGTLNEKLHNLKKDVKFELMEVLSLDEDSSTILHQAYVSLPSTCIAGEPFFNKRMAMQSAAYSFLRYLEYQNSHETTGKLPSTSRETKAVNWKGELLELHTQNQDIISKPVYLTSNATTGNTIGFSCELILQYMNRSCRFRSTDFKNKKSCEHDASRQAIEFIYNFS